MSVTKRKDGRYSKSITIGIKDGKPVKKYIYAKTLRELDKKYRDFMALKEHGGVQDVAAVTVEELSAQWLVAEKEPYLRPQTYENLVSQVKVMNSYFGHFRVQQLKYSDIISVQKKLIAEDRKRIYNRCLYLLRSLLQYGIREDIVLRDVTAGAKPLKIRKQTDRRALTDTEISLLMGAELDLYSKAMVYTFYYTGMRRGELIALQRQDVNLDEHYINISKTCVRYKKGRDLIQDFTKTSAGRRKVLIPPELEEVLREYIPTLKTDVLFPNRKGGALMVTSFRTRWDRICDAVFGKGNAPEEFTPHLLRHNFASMLYESGAPIKAAQKLLGHATVQTTLNIYTHFDIDSFDPTEFMGYMTALSARGCQKAVRADEESSNDAV